MEKFVRKFLSHAEADEADLAYYRSLTPDERVAIALELHATYYGTEKRMENVVRIVRLKGPAPKDA